MTSFITRVNGENKTYKIIIDTDEEEKYITIQEFCRALIDHSKPTSNIVEVVRCKDCVYFTKVLNGKCKWFNEFTTEEDFCSKAERKETDE